jgi:Nucleotidyltransferase domain
MQHHDVAIDRFVAKASLDPDILAVVVDGSVASGLERPDSDVDLVLIVTDGAFQRALDAGRLSWVDDGADNGDDGIGYEHGYYDIKVATVEYLDLAAERGDDPVRAAFLHAKVVWSRIEGIEQQIARISDVPDEQWEQRMASHIAQVRLHGGYFLNQACQLSNQYLLQHAAVHLVGSGGRALLARDHRLFQGQKYLERLVSELDDKPDAYEAAAAEVLRDPNPVTAKSYMTMLEEFYEWPLPRDTTLSRFVLDTELAWLLGHAPPEYS